MRIETMRCRCGQSSKSIQYVCDICNRNFELENDIRKESIPSFEHGGGYTSSTLDMCHNCSTVLRKVIYRGFAEIIDSGVDVSITRKFKDNWDDKGKSK